MHCIKACNLINKHSIKCDYVYSTYVSITKRMFVVLCVYDRDTSIFLCMNWLVDKLLNEFANL